LKGGESQAQTDAINQAIPIRYSIKMMVNLSLGTRNRIEF
jgi:hypothetical protein